MNKTFLLATLIILTVSGLIYWNKNQKPNSKTYKEKTIDSQSQSSRYILYSKSNYDSNIDKKRVIYFHAIWCPTCKVTNEEFTNSPDRIPEDVVVLKTDYDSENDLKSKYGITYQHTFVYVDSTGNEIKKWNGGGIDELIENTQ